MASRVLRSNPAARWTFHEGELGSRDVRELIERHFAAMRAISPSDSCHVLPPEDLGAPAITLWSLREAGALLGIGALKALSADEGEVKSMRTAPNALGRGVGTAMLRHIVARARARGYKQLSLETGSTPPFAAALRLYRREGFVPCGPFGGYAPGPFTRFFTLAL